MSIDDEYVFFPSLTNHPCKRIGDAVKLCLYHTLVQDVG